MVPFRVFLFFVSVAKAISHKITFGMFCAHPNLCYEERRGLFCAPRIVVVYTLCKFSIKFQCTQRNSLPKTLLYSLQLLVSKKGFLRIFFGVGKSITGLVTPNVALAALSAMH